ncbi:DYH12 protein, partial [Oxylabes madagascariensis]|nr:DYH12 protein [Oxylabes madagascariensis]
ISNKRTLRTLFRSAALPPPVTSEMSPSQRKLLAYHRGKEYQEMINQLLIDRALEVCHITMDEADKDETAPPVTELPSTVRKHFFIKPLKILYFQADYFFLKKCVQSNPVVPIQQQWLRSMLAMVPQSLMEGRERELLTADLLKEIVRDYEKSMQRCVLRRALIKPDIEELDKLEEEVPLPLLPLGLDFSSTWHNSYITAKNQIISTLHILHPTMKTLLDFGYTAFFNFLVVDFSSSRLKGPVDCKSFKTDASLSCSKAEDEIMSMWHQRVIGLFTQSEALDGVKLDQLESFYNCVAVLMSNQVSIAPPCDKLNGIKTLLALTTEVFVKLFDPEDRSRLPLFKMDLTFDENRMEFYPSLQDLEEAILFVVDCIGQTLQNVQTIRAWLMGGTATLDAELPAHTIQWAKSTLKKSIRDNLEGPKEHFKSYVESYGWLVDGTAEERINRFVAEQPSFDDYT